MGDVIDFSAVSTLIVLVLGLLALGIKLWALVDAITRPAPAFPAAGKLTKPVWVGILAASVTVVLLGLTSLLGLLGLLGTVAAIVYLVDVRPAVRELRRPGAGPYG
jgi:hypothetical protein